MAAVSIIMPVYNAARYLARAVASVRAQTVPDWELLLVDDGSLDGSPALCDALAAGDSRIRVLHRQNGGTASARNSGMALAAGEYLTFMDNDDFVAPYWLETMLSAARGAPGLPVKCGYWAALDPGPAQAPPLPGQPGWKPEKVSDYREEHISGVEYVRRMTGGEIDCFVWNFLIPRALALQVRFPVGRQAEDHTFCLELCRRAPEIVLCARPAYCWFIHPESQCHNYRFKECIDIAESGAAAIEYLLEQGSAAAPDAYRRCLCAFWDWYPSVALRGEVCGEIAGLRRHFARRRAEYERALAPADAAKLRILLCCPAAYRTVMRTVRRLRGTPLER